MLDSGFVSLHRSLLNWEWYKDTNTKAVFIHLLLTVNYKPGKWRGVTIERGQRVCSYASLAKETGLTIQKIRTAIQHLKSTGEITWSTTQKYSLVQVVKYEAYQDVTNNLTNYQQSSNIVLTQYQQQYNKDNKEIKNNNNTTTTTTTMSKYSSSEQADSGGGGGSDPFLSGLVNLWESIKGESITDYEGGRIGRLLEIFSAPRVEAAMRIAANANIWRLSYVEGVLNRWQTEDGKR